MSTDWPDVPLASELADFVYDVDLDALDASVVTQAKTLVIDALACAIAGASSEGARIALGATRPSSGTTGTATIIGEGSRTRAAEAALVNGAMLRALDMTDTYVGRDVCHPGECFAPALACAQAAGVSGKTFLGAFVAGVALHMALADGIALHRHGLHHVGQAAWVVPLVAARLLGHDAATAARALTIGAHGLIVPENFGLGQLTNLKALAYPLIARQSIGVVDLAAAGLTGPDRACEDVIALLARRFGMDVSPDQLVLTSPHDLSAIALKTYPAQYMLQPLIAAATAVRTEDPGVAVRLDRVVVRASLRTVERTADPAKYKPVTPEAADHSLPFCLAIALLDGALTLAALEHRWRDPDVLALMARIAAEAIGGDDGYQVGRQEIVLHFKDGPSRTLPCRYPHDGASWQTIAETKLRAACGERSDADRILTIVSRIEDEADLGGLMNALTRGRMG